MRCIKCGYQNIEGLRYCANCGQELMTLEEYNTKSNEEKSVVRKLYVIISFLSVILFSIIVYAIIRAILSSNAPIEPSITLDTEVIGTWNCKSKVDQENYDIKVILKTDSVFKWGTYEDLEKNSINGTFITKSLINDSEDYRNIYNLQLLVTQIITNGREDTKGSQVLNYKFALKDQNTAELQSSDNDNPESIIHCTREVKEANKGVEVSEEQTTTEELPKVVEENPA